MSSTLPDPCVMVITNRQVTGGLESLESAVEAAVAGGVQAVQLREKGLKAGPLSGFAARLRRITEGKALLIVNVQAKVDIELAVACHAEGVHLGEDALPATEVRRIDPSLLVGRSVHSVASAIRAVADGADYLEVGTVYLSESHPDGPVMGVGLLTDVAAAVSVPLLAVGGITGARAPEVMAAAAGIRGVAVIREILAAPSPCKATQDLCRIVALTGSHADAVQ